MASPVLRNTLILVGGQLAGVPLSIVVSAAMGRYLGADDLGYIYLAMTLTSFGFLLVEWGHGNVLAAAVARDRGRAGVLAGTSLAWRAATSVVVTLALLLLSFLLGYSDLFRGALLLVALQSLLLSLRGALQDVVRGFERTDVSAVAHLGFQLLGVVFILPTLILGGKLISVLTAQTVAGALVAAAVWVTSRRIGVVGVRFDRTEMKGLFRDGTSFMTFGFALALQPNIDAILMSKFAPADVLGWQAAAQRLMGLLMMPALALVTALYPTLSRLYAENMDEYRSTTSRALRATTLLAIPMALCCALYRSVGAQIFGKGAFGPVEQNLLVMSLLVFLLYFSMPLGAAILAAGRQRPFAIAQSMCVVVSLVLDPLLIPWFQERYGNGSLGVCAAGIVSELVVLTAAFKLIPSGVLDRSLLKGVGKGVLSGAVMVAVAMALTAITPYVAAPIAVAAYFACLWAVGGVEQDQVHAIRELVARKLARAQTSRS